MKSIIIKSLLAVTIMLPLSVNAAMINGTIAMGGSLLPTCAGIQCTMDVADGLDFTTPGLVSSATGDFAAFGVGFADVVTMTDFVFNPFANVNPLWTVEGFSFALETLQIVGQTGTFLELRGTGTITGNGFDATMGSWSLSANAASPNITFAWSSTAVAPVAAPEPGILLLLGMGLIGGLGVRRLTTRS